MPACGGGAHGQPTGGRLHRVRYTGPLLECFRNKDSTGQRVVFERLRGLFHRYADRHLSLDCGGFALEPADLQPPLGFVDRVEVRGNRVRVLGWSTAERVTLSWAGGQDSRTPHIPREDVANALGLSRYTGFALDAPLYAFPFTLQVQTGGQLGAPQPVASLTLEAVRRARGGLRWRFLGLLARLSPTILGYALQRDAARRDLIKRRLGLEAVAQAGPMETALFTFAEGEEVTYPTDTPVTVVMPVYNALDLTRMALARVAKNTDLPWHAVIIEDSSTDPAVRPWLRDWAADQNAAHPDRVTLLENETNLGFIGSVNKGLAAAIARGHHVVLLNSDALVPEGWASRLIRPMRVHDNVASVTPMSNDAEIFSSPVMCVPTDLAPGEADAVDAVARTFHPEATLSVAPTGVGFCMAMHIDWLRKLPAFDPVFGRGYGEEVDWCQKVQALGGRHLGLPGLYVEHRGGESFGSEAKRQLIQKNNQIVAHRYPTYDQEVQRFIAADPLITPRLALGIGLVAARAQAARAAVPIYVAHSLGGGAEDDLQRRVQTSVSGTGGAIVLRVGGPQRWQIEVITEQGTVSGGTDAFAFVEALLAPVGARRLIYSCGVGDNDPAALPDLILSLRKYAMRDRIEVLFHDFFPLSPSYCLLDQTGVYRGVPEPGGSDAVHSISRPDGTLVDLAGWRAGWGRLIAAAEHVTVFSEDSREIVLAAFPDADPVLRVQPHALLSQVPRIPAPQDGARPVIGVLGNIGLQKGARLVQDMARALQGDTGTGLVLVGNIDPAFGLPESTPIHGTYRIGELDQLAGKYAITCWLIPSVWPETFSFTTHEALASGLPVYTFALGAQGAAAKAAENGHPIPFDPDADLAQSVLEAVRADHALALPATAGASAPEVA